MLYAKVNENHEVLEFPIDEKKLRAQLSDVSLPDELTDAALAPYGYVCIPPIAPPPFGPNEKPALDTPYFDGTRWRRKLKIVPKD